METDASSIGWGAVLKLRPEIPQSNQKRGIVVPDDLEASGTWTRDVAFQHSNYRELLAVYMGLLSFKDLLKGLHVQILSDNVTTVAYVNQLGGPTPQLSNLMTTIWHTAQEHQISLSAKHLAGYLNSHVDKLSRIVSPYEWQLSRSTFRLLNATWGPHTVDHFSSFRTKQLPFYNTIYYDPQSEAVNTMAQNWRGENNFVNPPFWMLNRIIRLIISQKVPATVIAPLWLGQVWFQKLRRILVDKPIFIRNTSRNFLAVQQAILEPRKNPCWKLFAWRVHGGKV